MEANGEKTGKGRQWASLGCSSEQRLNWLCWKCPAQPATATSVSPHCSVPGTGTNPVCDNTANRGTEKLQRGLLLLLLPHFLLGPGREWGGNTSAADTRSRLSLRVQQQPRAEHGSCGCCWQGKEAGASKAKVLLCVPGEEDATAQLTCVLTACISLLC